MFLTIYQIVAFNLRTSEMVEHQCCDAANLMSVTLSSGMCGKKNHQEPIPDASYTSMGIRENSIAAAWRGGVTVSFELTVNLKNVNMCMVQSPSDYNSRGGR